MTIPPYLRQLITLINPTLHIGGLAVTESTIKFLLIKDDQTMVTASLRLPPGIIANGAVQDPKSLRAGLRQLHAQIAPAGTSAHVVLSLPPAAVYTQSFSVPVVDETKLAQSAELNMQMISPIAFENSYHGWQKIGEQNGGTQVDFLGAFAEHARVDAFIAALAESGFPVVAVEFPALGLARLVRQARPELLPEEPYLAVDVSADGIAFMAIKNLNLYFSHFHPWRSIQEELNVKQLTNDTFKQFLVREAQKVTAFYASGWGGQIKTAVLITAGGKKEIAGELERALSLSVRELSIKDFAQLDPAWFPALGSALRGLVPRARDAFISLTNDPVQVQYRQARVMRFTALWGKIYVTVAAFLFALIFGTNLFFASQETYLRLQTKSASAGAESAQVAALQEKAKNFNKLVGRLRDAKAVSGSLASVLAAFSGYAGSDVTLDKIAIAGLTVNLHGTAKNESAAFAFKNKLVAAKNITGVSLPLSNISEGEGGTVEFFLQFKLTSL